jgi:hypothetical protein
MPQFASPCHHLPSPLLQIGLGHEAGLLFSTQSSSIVAQHEPFKLKFTPKELKRMRATACNFVITERLSARLDSRQFELSQSMLLSLATTWKGACVYSDFQYCLNFSAKADRASVSPSLLAYCRLQGLINTLNCCTYVVFLRACCGAATRS